MKRLLFVLLIAIICFPVLGATLKDGVYTADFKTDSSMFHVNDAYEGKGVLTVKDGKMTIHVTMPSKQILKLFCGKADAAQAPGAALIEPTVDTVNYPDGTVEEAHGFDIPVTHLKKEFNCALVGKKGKWYDHKVSVSNPAPTVKDGSYTAEVALSGGTGRATVSSPAEITVENGIIWATVVWSSPNYDCMVVDGKTYNRINKEGNSTFRIPVTLDKDIKVSAQTTAMSTPHMIDYTFHFSTLRLKLAFATQFSVDYYEGGYKLLSLADGSYFFVVPEGKTLPKWADRKAVPLYQPIKNIYLAATSAMCLFDSLGRLDAVKLSGTKAEGWYIPNAKEAMNRGEILFAGRYNAPDYELITASQCPLAIESTMIGHAENIKEQLAQLGIAVLVDQSGNEAHPLGRSEWIKFYGALLNEEKKAEEVFSKQVGYLEAAANSVPSGKTVAFFYVSSSGRIIVRKSGDYVSKMISLAGGKYIFDNLGDSSARMSTVALEPEYFYSQAKDADIIIYNATTTEELSSLSQMVRKCRLLADFKAVKRGDVWCTGKNMYQETTSFGQMISNMHALFADSSGKVSELPFFYRLKADLK
jgi:iron complex transport system substrate-binding protein